MGAPSHAVSRYRELALRIFASLAHNNIAKSVMRSLLPNGGKEGVMWTYQRSSSGRRWAVSVVRVKAVGLRSVEGSVMSCPAPWYVVTWCAPCTPSRRGSRCCENTSPCLCAVVTAL